MTYDSSGKQHDLQRCFLCHATRDWEFVAAVKGHLDRHFDEVFCYEKYHDAARSFTEIIDAKLDTCGIFVAFVGEKLTDWQVYELDIANSLSVSFQHRKVVVVSLAGAGETKELPERFPKGLGKKSMIQADSSRPATCAHQIIEEIGIPWVIGDDDLPFRPQLFSYEKDIISFYLRKRQLGERIKANEVVEEKENTSIRAKLGEGCPIDWPQVVRWEGQRHDNPLERSQIGEYRPDDAIVLAAALDKFQTEERLGLLEAGPRADLHYPRPGHGLNVAILVSGGIAPGINAVIDGIVQRHWKYSIADQHALQMLGFRNGFYAFENLLRSTITLFPNRDVMHGEGLETSRFANEGGSMLGTSRVEELIDENLRKTELEGIVQSLLRARIDILYIIGGDGSMKAAHAIWSVARTLGGQRPLSVVAIPKTMDNDILWMWQSFGFLSAVQKAKEFVEHLYTESRSNPRLCVLQLFGSDSGFVVSHAVLASATGQCDVALIPEVPFSMLGLGRWLNERICATRRRIPHALVALAETAIPVDAMECLGDRPAAEPRNQPLYDEIRQSLRLTVDEMQAIRDFEGLRREGKRIQGQTSDHLRRAGLRIVMDGLPILLRRLPVPGGFNPQWDRLRVFANEPRHLLRAIAPSTSDILMAQRLGTLAVDNAMAGYTDFMISQWLTEFVLVPLKLVVLGRKRIPDSGIFWKSVLAKTGQPSDLVAPWRGRAGGRSGDHR